MAINHKKIMFIEASILVIVLTFVAIQSIIFTSKTETIIVVEKLEVNTSNIELEVKPIINKEKTTMSNEEIELIALVTMAEAEGEPEEGKRLVIDTILNRVDHKRFPNTVSDVIYQKDQFTSMWNGRLNSCYASDDICKLVKEEVKSRKDSNVIFFRTSRYSDYGSPMFQVGHHYFSSY